MTARNQLIVQCSWSEILTDLTKIEKPQNFTTRKFPDKWYA